MNTSVLRAPLPDRQPTVFGWAWLSDSYRSLAKKKAVVIGLLTATLLSAALSAAHAQATGTVTTLYSFTGGKDGGVPDAALIQGSDGSFYGTTPNGGAKSNLGTVFRITPTGTFTTLHSFKDGNEGLPANSALVQGRNGNFYGTTLNDGTKRVGTVYRITPTGAFTTLYNFTDGSDGAFPSALVLGTDGNFYGTTPGGGTSGKGTVFRITPAGALTTLYSFTDGSDAADPDAPLVQGSDGNFYGSTVVSSEPNRSGTVFRITPAGVLTTLHTFTGLNITQSPLIQGRDGNFYGVDEAGPGSVFQITPAGVFTTLYRFTNGSDGEFPNALALGTDGNFYSTTGDGGPNGEYGTVFRITPAGVLTTLYSFDGSGGGRNSCSALLQGTDGNFYGTTNIGGPNDNGTIFKLTITAHPAFFTGQVPLSNGVNYLAFSNGNYFGYYSFLDEAGYLYHFDLGYEYVMDANDGQDGVYLYDFASSDLFYTSPGFPFPYLYDFGLNSTVYYYPDPSNAGRYNTDGVRYFYDLHTGTIISK